MDLAEVAKSYSYHWRLYEALRILLGTRYHCPPNIRLRRVRANYYADPHAHGDFGTTNG